MAGDPKKYNPDGSLKKAVELNEEELAAEKAKAAQEIEAATKPKKEKKKMAKEQTSGAINRHKEMAMGKSIETGAGKKSAGKIEKKHEGKKGSKKK